MRKTTETFTGTGAGTTIDVSDTPYSDFGIQVNSTGAIISWTVILEGSLDGTTFTPLLTHTNLIGNAVILWASARTPVTHYRLRCAGISLGLGTNIVATALGVRYYGN